MSFEKSGKISGTRRKARECALQMLFAADLVGNELFSSVDYWSELGIDQLRNESSSLAQGFLDQCSKLETTSQNLRTWLKKLELPEETGQLIDEAKEIIHTSAKLQDNFRKFVFAFTKNTPISAQYLENTIQNLSMVISRLVSNVEKRILVTKLRGRKDDTALFIEYKDQMLAICNSLGKTLASVQKVFEEITPAREFADRISAETLNKLSLIDERIRTRTEHWRIERMAIVDRNVLRLAVYEFLFLDTPHTVVINEALEIARRFSTFEATQFINGILDAIKIDIDKSGDGEKSLPQASSGS